MFKLLGIRDYLRRQRNAGVISLEIELAAWRALKQLLRYKQGLRLPQVSVEEVIQSEPLVLGTLPVPDEWKEVHTPGLDAQKANGQSERYVSFRWPEDSCLLTLTINNVMFAELYFMDFDSGQGASEAYAINGMAPKLEMDFIRTALDRFSR